MLEPGLVPVAGSISVERLFPGVTVEAAHQAFWHPETPDDLLEAFLSIEPLALEWKMAGAPAR